jgi:hypothetical protein
MPQALPANLPRPVASLFFEAIPSLPGVATIGRFASSPSPLILRRIDSPVVLLVVVARPELESGG